MGKYTDDVAAVDQRVGALFKAIPKTMRPYGQPVSAVAADGALDSKTKELMVLSGEQQIELIEQHDTVPSVYVDADGKPVVGFHHVSSWVTAEDYDTKHAQLQSDGLQIAQEGLRRSVASASAIGRRNPRAIT